MHTIHQITDEHLICLDDNDNEYVISRKHFEQWLNDEGYDTIEERNRTMQIDWYDFTDCGDKSRILKRYVKKFGTDITIASVNAQSELS